MQRYRGLTPSWKRFSYSIGHMKVLAIGVSISMISLFLPWYSELSRASIESSFSAVGGPTASIGWSMFLLNFFCLLSLFYRFKFRVNPDFSLSVSAVKKYHGLIILYLTFLVVSVLFSREFGANGVEKTLGIGAYINCIGAVVSLGSGMLKD